MARFTLSWDNTELNNSTNTLNQRASYRQKSVGGAWLTDGFTPTNDFAKTVNTVLSKVLTANVIYEFKTESICTENGPVANENGVVEMIGFSCIEPDIVNTDTTSAIGVDLSGTDITKAQFTLRKTSNNQVQFGPIVAPRAGNMASAVAVGLDAATGYYWQIVLFATINGIEVNSSQSNQTNAVCGPYIISTDDVPVQNLVWVADTKACEKEGGYGLVKTITGLSSPQNVWYDAQNGLVYVADGDDATGNVYWFNPDTATAKADMIYSDKVNLSELYVTHIDSQYRRIYLAGANSGGLIVYDIDTDTIQTVAYGSNSQYSRASILVTADRIYLGDKSTNSITILNRDTLAPIATRTISSIPNNTRFSGGTYQMIGTGGEVWIVAGSGSSIGTVGVYNADLDTNIANITLTGAVHWNLSRYWQTGSYDEAQNRVYISDYGSSKRFVIDAATRTVLDDRVITNKSGKATAQVNWTKNPITGELYAVHTFVNSYNDGTPIRRTYRENVDTFEYEDMYVDQAYTGLSGITGTNNVVGSIRGAASWEAISGWGTDGSITIISNSAGTINTGRSIVLTLKQVDSNNGNLPTGQTKDNIVGDADYIAPVNDGSCAVTPSIDCPTQLVTAFVGTTLDYEFVLPQAVATNPNIAKITVQAWNTNTNSGEGTPTEYNSPFDNRYFNGEFTGLGGLNYTIKIKYLDATGVELQSC